MPYPLGGWCTAWRTIIPKNFSHCCEGSEPHVRLSSLRIWQKDWEAQGNPTLKASRILLQDFDRTREGEIPVLEDTNKTLHTSRLRGKEQWLHRKLNQNSLRVSEGLLRRCGSAGAHHRDRALAAPLWEGPPWSKPFWSLPLTWL